jgi:EAL domain-containing protein (putative c-di-GMP-specific phosphodiesterase class I)
VIGRASRRLALSGGGPTVSDVRRLLRHGAPEILAQPILDLTVGEVTGYEALARFPQQPVGVPQDWFVAAHRGGLGPALEARAIARALELGADRPAGTVLSVNVSPSVLETAAFQAVLPDDLTGLQIEITEHELDDGTTLIESLDKLRRRGAQIAVDDVGEGYAGLKRMIGIRPDVLKVDRAIAAGVSNDSAKVAVLEAVVHFAARTGAYVCAEGIETAEDLAVVAGLDVTLAQGWIVGRPAGQFFAASDVARKISAAALAGNLNGALRTDTRGDVVALLDSLAAATNLAEVERQITGAARLLGCERARLMLLEQISTDPLADSPTARLVLAERVNGHVRASAGKDGDDQLLKAADSSSLLLLPLVSAGRTVGLLECARADERPWSRAQLRMARAVAAATGPVAGNLAAAAFQR